MFIPKPTLVLILPQFPESLKTLILALCFLLGTNYSIAQKHTHLEVLLADDLKSPESMRPLNNGLEHLILNDSIRNNGALIQEEFFSAFSHLYIEYAGQDFEFFVGEAPSVLSSRHSSSSDQEIEIELSDES